MDGTFACPECGAEIHLKGVSPGRLTRCGWCASWVEVPFLPRAGRVKRRKPSRARGVKAVKLWWRRWPLWSRVSVVVLSVAVAVSLTGRLVRDRRASAECAALGRLVESADESERAGNLGAAVSSIEAALALGGKFTHEPPGLDELKRRRDDLSRREVTAKIAALDRGASAEVGIEDAGRAVGEALTLTARVAKDPAIVDLQPGLSAVLERLRERWAALDGVAARAAFDRGDAAAAMDLCERQHRTADDLPAAPRVRLQGEAAALARSIIEKSGAVVEAVRGTFTLGSAESYNEQLGPVMRSSLLERGYLPKPARPVWDEAWESLAPYRLVFTVDEHQDDTYLASPNRTSFLDGHLSVARRGAPIWTDRPTARTSVPLPNLPAYVASRLAAGAKRSPDFERMLYDDARARLRERIGHSLRNFPVLSPPDS